jgi:hypothetical protein
VFTRERADDFLSIGPRRTFVTQRHMRADRGAWCDRDFAVLARAAGAGCAVV